MRMKLLVVSALMAAVITYTPQATAHWNHPMPLQWYVTLAQCETNLNVDHNTKSYTSAFGIFKPTWFRYSWTPDAKGTTLEQQIDVVDRIAFYGWIYPNLSHKHAAGPWGWGCMDNRKSLIRMICESKKPEVRIWRRNCGGK